MPSLGNWRKVQNPSKYFNPRCLDAIIAKSCRPRVSKLFNVASWEFSERRARDESTWDDGGPLSRLGAHDADRYGDVEGAGDFQSQQRSRSLQFLAKCAWPRVAIFGKYNDTARSKKLLLINHRSLNISSFVQFLSEHAR